MITKEFVSSGNVRVTFSMPAGIWADTIYLAGDFNGWSTTTTPLQQTDRGWHVSLELEGGKSYQYRYLINGTDWYNDWRADRYEPNELGGDNSVVVVPEERELVATLLESVEYLSQGRGGVQHDRYRERYDICNIELHEQTRELEVAM